MQHGRIDRMILITPGDQIMPRPGRAANTCARWRAAGRQHHVPILRPFALAHLDDAARCRCRRPGVRPHRRGERGAALQARYRFEKLHDLVGAERNWQLAWFPSIGNALRDERLAERDAVEEPQRADDLVQRRPRDVGRDEMHLEGAQAPTGAATCRNTG